MTIKHGHCFQADDDLWVARCFFAAGQLEEARATFERVISNWERPETRIEFGQFLAQIGDSVSAVAEFQRALRVARLNKDQKHERVALNQLACTHRQRGEHAAADVAQRGSLSVELATAGIDLPTDLGNLAADAIAAGDYSTAGQLLRRSLALEIANGSTAGQAADYGNMALLKGLTGEPFAAIDLLRCALGLHRELRDLRGVGCDLMNLAVFFGELGRWGRAQRLLRLAVTLLENAHATDLREKALVLLSEADCVVGLRDFDPQRN